MGDESPRHPACARSAVPRRSSVPLAWPVIRELAEQWRDVLTLQASPLLSLEDVDDDIRGRGRFSPVADGIGERVSPHEIRQRRISELVDRRVEVLGLNRVHRLVDVLLDREAQKLALDATVGSPKPTLMRFWPVFPVFRPMATPKPAANIIENQEKFENSGFSPGFPRTTDPVLG